MSAMRALDNLIVLVSKRVWIALVASRQEVVAAERAESDAAEKFLDASEGMTRAAIEASPVVVALRTEARRTANAASAVRAECAAHEAAWASKPVMS
jgi:hypothetical protein